MARELTAEERGNVELARRYEALYNTDIERFVRECYAPDCEINGGDVRGHDGLLETSTGCSRRPRGARCAWSALHAVGDVVVVEAVLLDPDQGPAWKLPLCALLTCRDGRIATDWTYAEFRKWPGLRPPGHRRARRESGRALTIGAA